jgi:hypothetical protein
MRHVNPESFLTREAPESPGHVPDSGAQPLSGPALQVRDDSLRRPGCAEMDIRRLPGHGVKQPVLIL